MLSKMILGMLSGTMSKNDNQCYIKDDVRDVVKDNKKDDDKYYVKNEYKNDNRYYI